MSQIVILTVFETGIGIDFFECKAMHFLHSYPENFPLWSIPSNEVSESRVFITWCHWLSDSSLNKHCEVIW